MTLLNIPTREEKAAMLAKAICQIEDGELINVVDASFYAHGVCIGDFREIGWSERITTRRSMFWQWTGPHPVKVGGEIVQPEGYTEEIEMDWS